MNYVDVRVFIPASDPSHSRQIDHFKPELADTF